MGRRSACLRRGRVSNRFGSINKAGARHIPQEEHKQKVTAIIQVTKGIICEFAGKHWTRHKFPQALNVRGCMAKESPVLSKSRIYHRSKTEPPLIRE